MKIAEIGKLFDKLGLKVRSTGHRYGWLMVNDQKVLRVHYSHGKGDLPEKVKHKIRSQLKLSNEGFKDLVGCPMSYDEYLVILKKKGYL